MRIHGMIMAATAITPMTWRNTWKKSTGVGIKFSNRQLPKHLVWLQSEEEKIIQMCLCETIREVTAGCGNELRWLTVWKENDHCANSHLVAGENLPLGHSSSYLRLSRAFPSTPLACKPHWQSSQPTGTATVTGRELWEPQCGCMIHRTLTTQASTTQWLITLVNGSVRHLNQDTRAA